MTKADSDMSCYICLMCGYLYDPEVGDPLQGVDPMTSFADVDEEWTCPYCFVDKTEFERSRRPEY